MCGKSCATPLLTHRSDISSEMHIQSGWVMLSICYCLIAFFQGSILLDECMSRVICWEQPTRDEICSSMQCNVMQCNVMQCPSTTPSTVASTICVSAVAISESANPWLCRIRLANGKFSPKCAANVASHAVSNKLAGKRQKSSTRSCEAP